MNTQVTDLSDRRIRCGDKSQGEVEVEDGGVPNDPYAVRAPVEAGKSFTAKVRGSVRITATIPTTMENVFWKFDTP